MSKIKQLVLAIALLILAGNSFSQNDSIYHFQLQGKDYEVIKIQKTYADACEYAAQRNAHLVHVDDTVESDGIYDAIINGAQVPVDYTICYDAGNVAYVWIGATDLANEGEWLWDGDNDGEGINFWNGQGALGSGDGEAVDNSFVNWGGTGEGEYNEPDDYSGQDAAAIALEGWPNGSGNYGVAGEWNDIETYNLLYFVVEYEGNYGIDEMKHESAVVLSPNPAREILEVSCSEFIRTIEIIDITGKVVKRILDVRKRKVEIEVALMAKGIYVLKSTDVNNCIDYTKFIVR